MNPAEEIRVITTTLQKRLDILLASAEINKDNIKEQSEYVAKACAIAKALGYNCGVSKGNKEGIVLWNIEIPNPQQLLTWELPEFVETKKVLKEEEKKEDKKVETIEQNNTTLVEKKEEEIQTTNENPVDKEEKDLLFVLANQ